MTMGRVPCVVRILAPCRAGAICMIFTRVTVDAGTRARDWSGGFAGCFASARLTDAKPIAAARAAPRPAAFAGRAATGWSCAA
jgi:hypothetical protein